MKRYTRRVSYNRWSGSITDLDRVIQIGEDSIQEATGQSPKVEVDIVVGGLLITTDRPESVKDLTPPDIPRIRRLRVDLFVDDRDSRFLLQVVAAGDPAIEVLVSGEDRRGVEGVMALLKETLDPGRRWLQWSWKGATFASAALLGVGIGMLIGSAATIEDLSVVQRVVVAIAASILLLTLPTLTLLIPPLELLLPGEKTRFQRMRTVLSAFVIAIAAGLIVVYFTGD